MPDASCRRYACSVTEPLEDWIGGVAASPEAMDEVDEAWWLSMSVSERIALVVELSTSFDWSVVDEDDDVPRRVLGPDCGVRG